MELGLLLAGQYRRLLLLARQKCGTCPRLGRFLGNAPCHETYGNEKQQPRQVAPSFESHNDR
jgi:hypothetical protein